VPTYEYRCTDCSHQFERFQKMSDEPETECEACGGVVQRVLFPVAVHFKGSGFYTTDYARKKPMAGSGSSGGSGTSAGSAGSNGSGSGSSGGSAKKEEKVSTPAASKD
jgi:putative FmdB family regulatory protein